MSNPANAATQALLTQGVAYIREHAGGYAQIAILAHLAGVETAEVEALLKAE